MTRRVRDLGKALLAGVFALGLVGCPDEGPAENAGEAVDEGVERTGEGLEKATEGTQDAIEDATDQ